MELEAKKRRGIDMVLLTGYVAAGTMFALYGMAATVVCAEMIEIGRDLAGFRNK